MATEEKKQTHTPTEIGNIVNELFDKPNQRIIFKGFLNAIPERKLIMSILKYTRKLNYSDYENIIDISNLKLKETKAEELEKLKIRKRELEAKIKKLES